MKKYIAPAINVVNLATEESFLLTLSNGTISSKENQLSNKNVTFDEDWDDEE